MRTRLKDANHLALYLVGFFMVVAYVLTAHQTIHAQDSQISTTICDGQPPIITVTQPQTGSTVSASGIAVQGSVTRASSLSLERNGAHVTTIPISFSSNFNIPLTLVEGNNSIKLEAQFTCNSTDATEYITVEYKKPVVPPKPGDGGQPSPGGSSGGTGGGRSGSFLPGIPNTGIGSVVDRIKDNLSGKPDDIDAPDITDIPDAPDVLKENYKLSYVVLARSWSALALFIITLATLLLPKKYYNATLLATSKNSQCQTTIRRFVRLVAAILVIICIVVLQI